MSLRATNLSTPPLRLHLDQPQDEVAAALARAVQIAQLVDDMRLARQCFLCPAGRAALNRVRSVVA
jgi:hypothetical protein